MKIVEHRRHTMRHKPGVHLTQAGVDLARRVGNTMGKFALVFTSTIPRAYETAIAMGYAVDEQLQALAEMWEGVPQGIEWDAGFGAWSQVIQQGNDTARFAEAQADIMRWITARLNDGESALVISHGGIVEASALGALPNADHAAWGKFIDYCEGVRLYFEDGDCVRVDILRVTSTH